MSSPQRVSDEPAFVLHTHPYRETSLIVEVFSRHHGRMALVARGARRPRSAVRGLLMAFQPLHLDWFGKGELRTLHSAEWQGGQALPQGRALMCGFYLNELLLRLLARGDAHEALFDDYRNTLQELVVGMHYGSLLRRFELRLLRELGYGLTLDRESGTGAAVQPDHWYHLDVEHGAIRGDDSEDAVLGQTLLDMAHGEFSSPTSQQQSKRLMRQVLQHHLGQAPLASRQLLLELAQLE